MQNKMQNIHFQDRNVIFLKLSFRAVHWTSLSKRSYVIFLTTGADVGL